MTPSNSNHPSADDPRATPAPMPKSKQAKHNTGRIKMLLAAASVAGTLGGWAALAHSNTEDQAAAAVPVQAAYVPSTTDSSDQQPAPTAATADIAPSATATAQPSATATPGQQAQATAIPTDTATLQPSTTATTQPPATATTQPTQVPPTATTAKPTATAVPAVPKAVTSTKSSR